MSPSWFDAASPCARSTMTSLAPASPPTRICASSVASPSGVGDQHDDPHGVLARGVVRRLDRLFLQAVGRDDHEGQHTPEGDGAALFRAR